MSFARIIWDERMKCKYWIREKNAGATVRKFRSELRRQGVKFTETHKPMDAYRTPKYLRNREVVLFQW